MAAIFCQFYEKIVNGRRGGVNFLHIKEKRVQIVKKKGGGQKIKIMINYIKSTLLSNTSNTFTLGSA
jgi:hypothetical protein